MFLPRYSLRWLLAITVACAVGFSLVALALREVWWAAGLSVAVGSVLIVLAVHGLVFGLIDGIASFVPQQEVEPAAVEPISEATLRARLAAGSAGPAAPESGTPPDLPSEGL